MSSICHLNKYGSTSVFIAETVSTHSCRTSPAVCPDNVWAGTCRTGICGGNDTPPVPAVYCYDWALCIPHWLVISPDFAENDNMLKQNDRASESKRGEQVETGKKDRDPQSREKEMCKTHMHTQSCAVWLNGFDGGLLRSACAAITYSISMHLHCLTCVCVCGWVGLCRKVTICICVFGVKPCIVPKVEHQSWVNGPEQKHWMTLTYPGLSLSVTICACVCVPVCGCVICLCAPFLCVYE